MPQPMLPEEFTRRVGAWFTTKWVKKLDCPLCGVNDWSFNSSILELAVRMDIDGTPGGQGMPVIQVFCKNCGYTVFVSAVVAGILHPEPETTEEASS